LIIDILDQGIHSYLNDSFIAIPIVHPLNHNALQSCYYWLRSSQTISFKKKTQHHLIFAFLWLLVLSLEWQRTFPIVWFIHLRRLICVIQLLPR